MIDSRMPNMQIRVAAKEQPEQPKRDTKVLFSHGECEITAQAALLSGQDNWKVKVHPGLPSHAGSKAGEGYCPTYHAPPHARKFPANRDGSEAKAIAPRRLLSCRSNIKAAGLQRKHGGPLQLRYVAACHSCCQS
jgi:hypothetical protein